MNILDQFGLPNSVELFLICIVGYHVIMTLLFLIHKYVLGRRALQWMWYIMGPFLWLMLFRDATRTKKRSIAQLSRYGVMESGQVVLDYGCGTGSYAISASPIVGNGGKAYAADVNPFALYIVRLKAWLKGLKNVETILTDRDTGLPNESVDVVFMSDAFHDLKGKEGIIRKVPKAIAEIEKINLFSLSYREKKLCKFKKSKSIKKGINYCPKCGTPIKEGSLFCENCGVSLSKEKSKKKKPSKKISLKIISIIAIITMVIIGVTYLAFSELWKSTTTETPIQKPEGTVVQTTAPAPTTAAPTTSPPVIHPDEEYLSWTTETLTNLTKICELIKESIDANDWEALERHCGDLYDFAIESLDEEKQFKVSPELEPAKREFVKILNACRWAGHYGERGAKNHDLDDIEKTIEYLETATACIERFTELLEEYNATKK